ncbi:MAG: hypothetical protein Hyperionvirus9_69 [Hyperionvirus sp.]|uniref:Uncharacterized protein n=1 Tax=Hyperionvirus sp. TaxID=2487770 RepID=A0A3G5A992_9VIRU|nr:MAG: hypothetical protein Hyperionvirus9_69 [Hyperionvirus sp.]
MFNNFLPLGYSCGKREMYIVFGSNDGSSGMDDNGFVLQKMYWGSCS